MQVIKICDFLKQTTTKNEIYWITESWNEVKAEKIKSLGMTFLKRT